MRSAMHRDRGVTDAAKGIGIVSGRTIMHRQLIYPSKVKMPLLGADLGALVNVLALSLNRNPGFCRHARSRYL